MPTFTVSPGFAAAHPGADRGALRDLPEMHAYTTYYNRFKKTYHVLLQLASVALEGRSLPTRSVLVDAMFMAELKNRLLTAGHDLDRIHGGITLDTADGTETYTLLRGEEQRLKPGDMYMADGEGVLSSVIYGPDRRTRITGSTANAAFTVYAPSGIHPDAVRRHLEDLRDHVLLACPGARAAHLDVYGS